jgi:SHS2 domain-containing protein
MFFCEFDVKIKKLKGGFELNAKIFGEKMDHEKHEFKTEVKGVSYTQMKIEENKECKIRFILDV